MYNQIRSIIRDLISGKETPDEYGNIKSEYLQHKIDHIFSPNRCIFIHIPKTAGISVCESLFGIDSVGHYNFSDYARLLDNETLHNYFKFTFVRNPYSRIYSGYTYLLKGGRGHKNDITYQQKINHYKDFEDFILNFIGANKHRSLLHFKPQVDFLKLNGTIDFDFIGRVENINEDFNFVKERLGKTNAALEHKNASNVSNNFMNNFSTEMQAIIRDKYKEDFIELGYDF